MMTILAPTYWILSASEVYSGFLRGVGQSLYPMISTVVTMGVARVGFVLIVRSFWDDITAVYLSYPFSWILQAISMLVYVNFGRWQSGTRLGGATDTGVKHDQPT